MTEFAEIEAAARLRVGGEAELKARLPKPKSAKALRALGDDRYLSLIALRVFRAGLKHSLVDAKWPAFEEVFHGFQPGPVRAMSDEAMEALMADSRLIRHWPKLKSVRANAAAVLAIAREHGSFGNYLADWPGANIVELWADLAKRLTQMGGASVPRFLRMVGKDRFVLTDDVARALVHWGAFAEPPKGKAGQQRAQEAFNRWAEATDKPLCQISMVLALSIE